jgi:hypothetical protein
VDAAFTPGVGVGAFGVGAFGVGATVVGAGVPYGFDLQITDSTTIAAWHSACVASHCSSRPSVAVMFLTSTKRHEPLKTGNWRDRV